MKYLKGKIDLISVLPILIGIGVIVSNNINICGDCIIGAGAVVVKDIDEPGTYVGMPAKLTKKAGE